ncbi:MAG: VOC family protein [Planctomycetes bacterium]|nr:VOC family protein [Planctomycetota bacterium]MBL7009481.1 VOC family protein [Planctomycetota bacterium]
MNRVIHFEIHAEDPQRAMDFYAEVFDWSFQAFGGPLEYWTVVTGPDGQPGINGGLMRRQGPAPEEGQALISWVGTIEVASIDDSVAAAVAAGGRVVVPKMEIPGVGWSCSCKDPEGNVFGLFCA